jgi:hypothetical protein
MDFMFPDYAWETLNASAVCGEPTVLCAAGLWRIKGLAPFLSQKNLRFYLITTSHEFIDLQTTRTSEKVALILSSLKARYLTRGACSKV